MLSEWCWWDGRLPHALSPQSADTRVHPAECVACRKRLRRLWNEHLESRCHRMHLLQRLRRKGRAFTARIPRNRNREQMYLVSLLSEARFLSGVLYFWRHQNNFLLINFHLIQRNCGSARSSEPPGGRAGAALCCGIRRLRRALSGRQEPRYRGTWGRFEQQRGYTRAGLGVPAPFERTWNVELIGFLPFQ